MSTIHPFPQIQIDNKNSALSKQNPFLLTKQAWLMSKESAVPTDLKLHSGEVVHKVIRPVKNGFLGPMLSSILIVVVLVSALFYVQTIEDDNFLSLLQVALYPMLGIGLIASIALVVGSLIQMAGNLYIITNRRIIGRFDFIVHRESTIYFERIQNVKVHQNFIDNIVNTGSVFVETAAGSMMPEENLRWISNPREIRQTIMDLIEVHKKGSDGLSNPVNIPTPVGTDKSESTDVSEILGEILNEIKSIREEIGK